MNKKPLICLILLFVVLCITNNREYFRNYMTLPYNYINSGSDPITFYEKKLYRKPYRWPYRVFTSYPVPHMRPYV